jgi:hypothetical protein
VHNDGQRLSERSARERGGAAGVAAIPTQGPSASHCHPAQLLAVNVFRS